MIVEHGLRREDYEVLKKAEPGDASVVINLYKKYFGDRMARQQINILGPRSKFMVDKGAKISDSGFG